MLLLLILLLILIAFGVRSPIRSAYRRSSSFWPTTRS